MPKKPSLPGAADFFALAQDPEEAQPTSPDSEGRAEQAAAPPPREPSRRGSRPADSTPQAPQAEVAARATPELAPPATVPVGPTEKVTFYLHPLSLRRLELLKAQMLVERNLKVNRSQIIDLLLEEALEQPEPLTQKLLALAEPSVE